MFSDIPILVLRILGWIGLFAGLGGTAYIATRLSGIPGNTIDNYLSNIATEVRIISFIITLLPVFFGTLIWAGALALSEAAQRVYEMHYHMFWEEEG